MIALLLRWRVTFNILFLTRTSATQSRDENTIVSIWTKTA